jgi:hypothetical protein
LIPIALELDVVAGGIANRKPSPHS